MENSASSTQQGMPKNGTPYIFRVFHDKSRAEEHELNDAQVAHEYAQFSAALTNHYDGWPGIEASCLEQPPPQGGLLVRLKSDLPVDAIHNSLSQLLVYLNQRNIDNRIGHPSFVMQQMNNPSSRLRKWPTS